VEREGGGYLYGTQPDCVAGWQAGHEQRCLPCENVQRPQIPLLVDPKQVVEERLLPASNAASLSLPHHLSETVFQSKVAKHDEVNPKKLIKRHHMPSGSCKNTAQQCGSVCGLKPCRVRSARPTSSVWRPQNVGVAPEDVFHVCVVDMEGAASLQHMPRSDAISRLHHSGRYAVAFVKYQMSCGLTCSSTIPSQ